MRAVLTGSLPSQQTEIIVNVRFPSVSILRLLKMCFTGRHRMHRRDVRCMPRPLTDACSQALQVLRHAHLEAYVPLRGSR